jgi:hypothetical protein
VARELRHFADLEPLGHPFAPDQRVLRDLALDQVIGDLHFGELAITSGQIDGEEILFARRGDGGRGKR